MIGLLMIRQNLKDMKTLGADVDFALASIDVMIDKYRIEVLEKEVVQ